MYKPFWTIAAWFGVITTAARNDTFGFLELDFVFPRNGATYPPFSDVFLPVTFAFQNFHDTISLSNAFRPRIAYSIWDQKNESNIIEKEEYDLYAYLVSMYEPNKLWYDYRPIANVEGTWQMNWTVRWPNCDGVTEHSISYNNITFSTKSSAGELDLVAATGNGTACPKTEGQGVAWNITALGSATDGFCSEMVFPLPKPTPCKIQIDPAEAARILRGAAFEPASSSNPTPSPEVQSGAQNLFAGRAAISLAILGLLIHI